MVTGGKSQFWGVGGISEALKSAALCTTVHSYVGVSGATEGASEAPSAHPLYNSAVHCLCDAVAKATAEKGQLT